MSTTTIRLPDDLKARVTAAAKNAGTSTHNFILEAVAEKTGQAEQYADFDAEAETRYARFVESGTAIAWPDMRDYLHRRMAKAPATPPSARKLAK